MANKKERDHKLMARVADNDLAAFNELVDLYKGKLFTMLVRMVGTEQEAEDLMKLEQFMISTANRIDSTVAEKK